MRTYARPPLAAADAPRIEERRASLGLQASIDHSPRALAQRRTLQAAFGEAQRTRSPQRIAAPVVQRETIINYGSGTSLETMMPEGKGDFVLNVDTGHMMLAEVLMDIIKTRDLNEFGQLAQTVAPLIIEDKELREEEYDPSILFNDTFWIKHVLFARFPGDTGVTKVLSLLPGHWQKEFMKREETLKSTEGLRYARGSSEGLQKDHHMMHDVDTIYCINGYGYSPLDDPAVYVPMFNALRTDGRLIIISAASGPTVKPAHNWSRGQINKGGVGCTVETLFLKRQPILDYFDFSRGESSVEKTTSGAMGKDANTLKLETRHTEGGTKLEENNITIRLVLKPRER